MCGGERRDLEVPAPPVLSSAEGEWLVECVARTLRRHICGDEESLRIAPASLESVVAGAFVTLTVDGALRGCIGQVSSTRPLPALVAEMAIAAAKRDPRFDPVQASELAHLDVDVTVLGRLVAVPQRLRSLDGAFVEVGTHGLQVRRGGRSGLLLPQVARRLGLSALEFLRETCAKAGLPAEAWRDEETEVLLFRAASHSGERH